MVFTFTPQQSEIIRQLGFDPEANYDEARQDELLEAVADCLMDKGFDAGYKANDNGNLYEDIVTIITE